MAFSCDPRLRNLHQYKSHIKNANERVELVPCLCQGPPQDHVCRCTTVTRVMVHPVYTELSRHQQNFTIGAWSTARKTLLEPPLHDWSVLPVRQRTKVVGPGRRCLYGDWSGLRQAGDDYLTLILHNTPVDKLTNSGKQTRVRFGTRMHSLLPVSY